MNKPRALSDLLKLLLIDVLATAALHYFADLKFGAAYLLAFVFTAAFGWLYVLSEEVPFRPYKIVIGVKFSVLRDEFKLPATNEALFENFSFTAINSGVFAHSDDREYSSDINIWTVLPCNEIPWQTEAGSSLGKRPLFFFIPVRGGHQFGIHVVNEWWESHRSQSNASVRDLKIDLTGRITLGFLPAGYLPNYFRFCKETVVTGLDDFERKNRPWKQKLDENGWTAHDEYMDFLDHRYLRIAYYQI